jgi:hypothetical protein
MNISDKNLFNKLAMALVLKLAILMGLWWVFVRDHRVALDGNSVAAQFLTPVASTAQGSKP